MHRQLFDRRRHRLPALAVALASAVTPALSGAARAATADVPTSVPIQISAPASTVAPANQSQCPAHYFCMWQNYNYNQTGNAGFWAWSLAQKPANSWFYVGAGANDQATSIYNPRGWATGIDKDWNPASQRNKYCLPTGYANPNLTQYVWPDGSNMNDSISSVVLSNSANSCPLPPL